jgi:hypothetical protein
VRQLLKHISPTTVLAAAALFVALAGSSTAAVDNVTALITGAQIKNGSVTGADVKNKSLTAADIKGRLRGPQGLRGAAGPTGAQGPQGPPGIQRLVSASASKPAPMDGVDSVIASCPAGMLAVNGGFETDSDGAIYSSKSQGTGWFVGIDTRGATLGGTFTAYVSCSPNIGTAMAR